jgi:hypothetical protein
MTDWREDETKVRELLELTQALPLESEPPESAWEAVRAQLTDRLPHQPPQVAVWQRPAFLAAAAFVLVAASSALTSVALTRAGARDSGPAVASTPPAGQQAGTALTTLALRENQYLQTVNGLNKLIDESESELAPGTVRTIRASLLVIDAAILEVRQALAEDPGNGQLLEILTSNYEKKVDLLRRTTAMVRS